jgi:serine/threonine protein kinase
VGRYRIESKIGKGGYGEVYRATDEVLHRPVAIKIAKSTEFRSEQQLADFLAEARAAAGLRHPGIVTIYDVGELVPGVHCISMELISGSTLQKLLEQERLSHSRIVHLLAKTADAIHYAHGKGLIHRDLKPSNILLDERHEPRVVDFGLAVHEQSQSKFRGQVAGTPGYMAPEQYRGSVHHFDGRCDIWALGIILYQMLTGRRPFIGTTEDLCDQVLNRDPKPPRQVDDQIPRELEAICLKCLAKSPAERYLTAGDLAEALRGWNSDQNKVAIKEPEHAARPHIAVEAETSFVSPKPARKISARRVWIVGILLVAASFSAAIAWNSGERRPSKISSSKASQPLIEDETGPLVWHGLLGREPERLVWGGDSPVSTSKYDDLRKELWINANDIGVFGTGVSKSRDFTLQASIARSNWVGSVGLFWGFQRQKQPDGGASAACEAITLTHLEGAPGRLSLARETCAFVWLPRVLRPGVSVSTEEAVGVTVPAGQEFVLEVTVVDGRLAQVRFQGAAVGELKVNPLTAPALPADTPLWLGVVHTNGTSIFQDVRIKLLNSKIQTETER